MHSCPTCASWMHLQTGCCRGCLGQSEWQAKALTLCRNSAGSSWLEMQLEMSLEAHSASQMIVVQLQWEHLSHYRNMAINAQPIQNVCVPSDHCVTRFLRLLCHAFIHMESPSTRMERVGKAWSVVCTFGLGQHRMSTLLLVCLGYGGMRDKSCCRTQGTTIPVTDSLCLPTCNVGPTRVPSRLPGTDTHRIGPASYCGSDQTRPPRLIRQSCLYHFR